MSVIDDSSAGASGFAAISVAEPRDYLALVKPRVMQLVVVTALAGILLAPHPVNFVIGLSALICIAVGAGASGALNMWYDADIDALMRRTSKRPIPTGRVTRTETLTFGLVLSSFAVVTLFLVSNALAAGLLAFTIFFYVVIYTMWLKRSTPQNIVIGGAAGALPPIVGYAAATGHIDIAPLVLFGLIFAWTPPHFWALALARTGDYGNAGVPMMPNVKGADHTRLEILVYSVILAAIGLLPYAFGFASIVYGIVSLALGIEFIRRAVLVFRVREGEAANKTAMRLFWFSIIYLYVLFAELLIERVLFVIGAMR